MSSTFFGLLRLGRQNTADADIHIFLENQVPPITRRILTGMPQELTEQSCAQRLRQIAADYGYGIEMGFETIERYTRVGRWPREVTDLLLDSERTVPGVDTDLMTQVVLPFEIHPALTDEWKTSGAEGAHLIISREFGGGSGLSAWKHIRLPRFMIDVFFEEWVCEVVFAFIHLDGGIMPAPKSVLAKPVSIFQAAADITAALCMAVASPPHPISSMASYTLKSDYHPKVDRVLSSFATIFRETGDTTPPSVTKVEPVADTLLKDGDTVTVNFNKEIYELKLAPSPSVKSEVKFSDDKKSAIITLSELPADAELTLSITAKDIAGNEMKEAYKVKYKVTTA